MKFKSARMQRDLVQLTILKKTRDCNTSKMDVCCLKYDVKGYNSKT